MKPAWRWATRGLFLSGISLMLALVLALAVSVPASAAPSSWTAQRTELIQSELKDTFFLPGMTQGWAVGSPHFTGSALYHCYYTGDSGVTWTPQTVGDWVHIPYLIFAEMEAVSFRSANNGYAVGQVGIISKCTNGAAGTWTVVRLGTSTEVLQDVMCPTDTEVWVVGVDVPDASNYSPLVLHSTDAGASWSNVDLRATSFANENEGWAVGDGGVIIHTSDGGLTWALQDSGVTGRLNAVQAVGATEAWAAGDGGAILHTSDGGTTWSGDLGANDVCMLDATHAWVVGQGGFVMFYNGTNWDLQDSGYIDDLNAVDFIDEDYGWAVGDSGRTIYTSDGGATWTALGGIGEDLHGVSVYDDSGSSGDYLIHTCGTGGSLYYTSDASPGGLPAAWTAPAVPPPAEDLRGIDFSTATTGWVCGANGTMAFTVDGGVIWNNGSAPPGVDFRDVTWTGTGGNWFAVSADGGMWQTRYSDVWGKIDLNDAAYPDADTTYYVGGGGAILKQDRGTGTWTVQDSTTSADLFTVEFRDADHGWVGGDNTVLYTHDGGTTWNSHAPAGAAEWKDVSIFEDGGIDYICAVGSGGHIEHTTDDGINPGAWNVASTPTATDMNAVSFINQHVGWAMGEDGTVWQTYNASSPSPAWDEVDFKDAYTVSETEVYFVGDGGTLVHWDGTSAEIQYNPGGWTINDLTSVYFASSGYGWAVGEQGTVIPCVAGEWGVPQVVTDGTGTVYPAFNDVRIIPTTNSGYAVADGGYYARLAAGTWGTAGQVGGANPDLYTVDLTSVSDGWAVGDDGYYTQLVSNSWSAPAQVGGTNPDLNAIWLTGADSGYAVGDSGYHVELSAGAWNAPTQVGGDNPDLYGITRPASSDGWAVGGNGTYGYRVPIDSGTYGTVQQMPGGARELYSVSFDAGGHGVAAGAFRTVCSYDIGGAGWMVRSGTKVTTDDFTGFDVLPGNPFGFGVGTGGLAYRLDNGFIVQTDCATTNDLFAVQIHSPSLAWAVGEDGTVSRYTGTWSVTGSATTNDLFGLDFLDNNNGVAVGEGRFVENTINGATDWTMVSGILPTTDDFLSVDFTGPDHGEACGQNAVTYTFIDGLLERHVTAASGELRGVSIFDDAGTVTGFMVGQDRQLLYGDGSAWYLLSTCVTTEDIRGVSAPAGDHAWFTGTDNLVLCFNEGLFDNQTMGGPAVDYNAVSMVQTGPSTFAGAVVGDGGAARYTDDGGMNWFYSANVGTTENLNAVGMGSATGALLCGEAGVVRRSTDGGRNWDAAISTPPSTTGNLNAVAYADTDNAWIAGDSGAVFSSTDAGDNWSAQNSGVGSNLYGLDALFDGVNYDAWAVGSCRAIVRTIDGGSNWTVHSQAPSPGGLMAADYVDATDWYAVGFNLNTGGEILHTTDGGATFDVEATGIPPLYGIDAFDAGNIWAAGDSGAIFYGNGAGAWAPQAMGGPGYRDISIAFDGVNYCGVAVGVDGHATYTTNGGGAWNAPVTNSDKNTLYGANLQFLAGPLYKSFAAGDSGTIMRSLDGGVNWAFARGPANTLNATSFLDDSSGWACGTQGTILYTIDGGVSWAVQDSGTTTDLNGISIADAFHAWAVGDGGEVYFYDGFNWTPQVSGTTEDLLGVYAIDGTNVWAVGANGTARFCDGTTWFDRDSGSEDLYAVGAYGTAQVWAVGANGTILSWNGASWDGQDSGVGADLLGVCAANATSAWAVGTAGTIVNTTDAGAHWSQQASGTLADLRGVAFDGSGHPDVRNGWIVGANELADQEATIKSTTDGGATWLSDTSNTGQARTLRGIDLAWGGDNWDAVAVGDWGRVQTLSVGTAQPSITPPLSPTSGPVGAGVTINGNNFGADQAAVHGHVFFHPGVEASVSAWNDTQITCTVPAGAYGYEQDVYVVNDGGSSPGEPFTVKPWIDTVTGPVTGGDTVTVTGNGFGADPGAGKRSSDEYNVSVDGARVPDAGVTSWSDTEIQFVVPDDTAPGTSVPVAVTTGGAGNSSDPVGTQVNPNVTDVDPASGPTGTEVTLTGTNFGTNPGAGYDENNCVRMNRMDDTGNIVTDVVPAPHITGWTELEIQFTIPDDALFHAWTGPVYVYRSFAQSAASGTLSVEPDVTGFAPGRGNVGDQVTINGSGFWEAGARAAAGGHVYFNGVETTDYISEHYGILIVEVPECVSGPVSVTTVGGTFTAGEYTVIPEIDSLSVNQGRVGSVVTITGAGFGTSQETSTVTFNGAPALASAWGANSITVTVPEAATTGDVVVNVGDEDSNALPFSVLPRITGINPSSGVPGTTVVTVNGYTFGGTQGTSIVTFNGTDAGAADSWSANRIRVTVPAGATTGDIVVTTAAGPSNGWAFSVGPRITAIDPTDGPPGSEVTITGTNFRDTQGNSTVTFNGVAAENVSRWTDKQIVAAVPEGAETGDVTVTTTEGTSNAARFAVGLSHTYYFAEGTTRPNFDCWLCLMNPNGSAITVDITYMKGDGTTKDQQVNVPKTSRTTLFVADAVGPDQDVSIKAECTKPFMAERPMYFNYGGVWTGGHDVVGAIAPGRDWYFAEGTTRDGFCEYLCLQNPGTEQANVTVTYMLQGGENKVQNVTIDPTSRETIDVLGFLGPNVDCSAYVHSDKGIIAERPMYFIYKPGTDNWTGGHDVVGASSPREEWFFAEGTTRDGFDEWLCLQNPGTTDAMVNIVYMLGTGENRTQVVTVPASSRITVDVVTFLGRGQDVSMKVTSDRPVVAERPMYFDYVGLTGGSDVVGATFSSPNWYFAEGATQNGFQEWLSIQNPNSTDAVVNITYMLGTGENIEKSVVVKANSRSTVDVNNEVGWGQDVSAKVVGSRNIIVERPMYFNYRGVWTGGHDVVGFHY